MPARTGLDWPAACSPRQDSRLAKKRATRSASHSWESCSRTACVAPGMRSDRPLASPGRQKLDHRSMLSSMSVVSGTCSSSPEGTIRTGLLNFPRTKRAPRPTGRPRSSRRRHFGALAVNRYPSVFTLLVESQVVGAVRPTRARTASASGRAVITVEKGSRSNIFLA